MAAERYAVVRDADGVVTNVMLYDVNAGSWTAPIGHSRVLDLDGAAQIGGTWNGEAFAPPAPLIPTPEELAFAADKALVRDYVTDAQLDAFLANAAPSAAAQLAALKGTIRALRALARATRYAIGELKEEA